MKAQKEAWYYEKSANTDLICHLCPHNCRIGPGRRGICDVRRNHEGMLVAETYEKLSSMHLDPVEKKPFYHYFPGSMVLSVGTVGCNMSCSFCQNCEISRAAPNRFPFLRQMKASEVIEAAVSYPSNLGLAYTYNEPSIWYEFMYDMAVLAKKRNLKNLMVSNGYISKKPLEELLPYMDAFNIDLKAFNNDFYRKITGSRLQPVLETLKTISKHHKHLEITNLVIPGLNDNEEEFEQMAHWISLELGPQTVLHISRYFPMHKMKKPPTPVKTLEKLQEIANDYLDFVYTGNV